MSGSGGNLATSAIQAARKVPFWRSSMASPYWRRGAAKRWAAVLLVTLASVFASCGVQAPPRPPRVEIPRQITDLRATQTGRTFHISFTMPVLAVNGELLTKPVTIDIFRAVSPPGQKPAPPATSAAPWLSFSAKELSRYTHAGKVDVPFQISPQDFRRQEGSTFAFAVVAFTRGFMGHARRSAPSNIAQAALVDVTNPVTNLVVKVTQTALQLTWAKPSETLTGRPPSHLSGYRIYQSTTGKPDTFQLLTHTTGTHLEDKNFHFGRQYYFRVNAVTTVKGTVAESEPSAPVGVIPRDVFPPAVPTGLTAVNAAGAIDLLWNASTAPDLAGYNVYRSVDGGPFERVNKRLVPTPIFHDTSVTPDHHYQYAVTAVDLSGNESKKSKSISITTPSPAPH